nr:hypothetical protein CFP56_36524 [Quercus suber]
MDPSFPSSLQNLQLTKEEEEAIPITVTNCSGLLEECSLSLFGRLVSDRQQNQRALKNTPRLAWKMGSDMRIVEVGNNILQFKFSSKYQMKWVESLGMIKKHCPISGVWQTACHQYGDWLRAGWTTKVAAKERNSSKDTIRVSSDEIEVQQMTRPVNGYALTWLEASGLVGRKKSLEKGDAWGSNNTTCADGQLAGDVQAFSRPTEQMMSAVTGQDLSVLGSCEKSRDHLR